MDTIYKNSYVSPPTGLLEITVIRDAQPRIEMMLDLGIPFTVFSLKFPLVEEQPKGTSGLVAEAVHILLDEAATFMMSMEYDEEQIVILYATVLAAFKGMSGEADSSKEQDKSGADPTVKTFEGTFNLPMAFVNETQKRIVTAASVSRYDEFDRLFTKWSEFYLASRKKLGDPAYAAIKPEDVAASYGDITSKLLKFMDKIAKYTIQTSLFEDEKNLTSFANAEFKRADDVVKYGLDDDIPWDQDYQAILRVIEHIDICLHSLKRVYSMMKLGSGISTENKRHLLRLQRQIDDLESRIDSIRTIFLNAKESQQDTLKRANEIQTSIILSLIEEINPFLNQPLFGENFNYPRKLIMWTTSTVKEMARAVITDDWRNWLSIYRIALGNLRGAVEELLKTYTKTSATKIQRSPKVRHIELTYDPAPKTNISDAARMIRQYRNRSLKQQPRPLYVIVYDQMGRPSGTLALGPKFKNQLLSLTQKRARAAVDFTSPVSFPDEHALKSGIKGLPKTISVGDMTYLPSAVAGTELGLYQGPQDWLVVFPGGRSGIFPGRPTFRNMRRLNFPVPRNRFKWTILPSEPEPEEDSPIVKEASNSLTKFEKLYTKWGRFVNYLPMSSDPKQQTEALAQLPSVLKLTEELKPYLEMNNLFSNADVERAKRCYEQALKYLKNVEDEAPASNLTLAAKYSRFYDMISSFNSAFIGVGAVLSEDGGFDKEAADDDLKLFTKWRKLVSLPYVTDRKEQAQQMARLPEVLKFVEELKSYFENRNLFYSRWVDTAAEQYKLGMEYIKAMNSDPDCDPYYKYQAFRDALTYFNGAFSSIQVELDNNGNLKQSSDNTQKDFMRLKNKWDSWVHQDFTTHGIPGRDPKATAERGEILNQFLESLAKLIELDSPSLFPLTGDTRNRTQEAKRSILRARRELESMKEPGDSGYYFIVAKQDLHDAFNLLERVFAEGKKVGSGNGKEDFLRLANKWAEWFDDNGTHETDMEKLVPTLKKFVEAFAKMVGLDTPASLFADERQLKSPSRQWVFQARKEMDALDSEHDLHLRRCGIASVMSDLSGAVRSLYKVFSI